MARSGKEMADDSDDHVLNEDIHRIIEENPPISELFEEKGPAVTLKDYTRQIIASCVSFCVVIQVGANMSFSAIFVPQLSENDDFAITRSEASWIASLVAIALPFGSLIVGPLMDYFGRKLLTIFIGVPYVVAWLFLIFATKLWHMYLARIIAGFTGGLTTVAIVYVSEVSHPTLRQALLSLNSVFVSFGVLLCYFCGTLLQWKLTAVVMCLATVATSIAMYFMPESPYWYIIFKDDYSRAQRSLRWVYKDNAIYHSQYQQLLLIKAKRRNNTNSEPIGWVRNIRSIIQIYTEKAVYKPTIILVLLFVAQQITGGYVIIFYATDILRKLDGSNPNQRMSEFASLVLLGAIRCLTSVFSVIISKNHGRRTIMIISGVGMAFCSVCAGLYIYFTLLPNEDTIAMNITTSDKTYNIANIFLLGYVAFGSLGFLVIPWTLIGELLPVKVRGVLGGALVSFAYVVMFMFLKAFPSILDSVAIHCILYAVSILNIVSVMFVYFFLPETLHKNFTDIEKYFER